jgi:hypothetical protein
MRVLSVGAALAVGLVLAGHAHAQVPTNVHQVAKGGNGFDLGITRALAAPVNLFTSVTGIAAKKSPPPPIVQPQQLGPINTTLASFMGKPGMPSNSHVIGLSTYPSQDQMPGAGYLKAFGAYRPKPVPIDVR